MTKSSPFQRSVALQSENKGSTYGKAISAANSYSFQGPQRTSGLYDQDGTQVLCNEVALYQAQSSCIIKADELTRGPATSRN